MLYPSKSKNTSQIYDDKMVKKILKKVKDREAGKSKKIKDKYFNKNIFFLKNELNSDPKLYLVCDTSLYLNEKTTCLNVLQLIWYFQYGS